ncbi:acid ceramidase-like [Mizuhopecten yessoensis]|uniref:Acid ceramidase n=1 Tax=Mizuhopecten yessoensis TaxID=6573 RepID=A0A210R3S0_MIZYE|nr:acid ceramidase-like [Mizuhopecten yessoensis]OWF55629.1 Acid ceramidase [Mizuhopecten yessoensis]
MSIVWHSHKIKMQRLLMCFVGVISLTNCQIPPFMEECVNNAYPPPASHKVPSYVVNLDLPAAQRWTPVVKNKGHQIKMLLDEFKSLISDIFNGSQAIADFIDKEGPAFDKTLPQPFADEMRGIANVTGLELGEIVFFNVFYEFFTVCTSIVAQDSTGKLYHARNLDFGLFLGWDIKNNTWAVTELLRPMVSIVDFQKGGKTVFKSVSFAGYIGILTAIKPGKFTLTMNERFNKDGGYIGLMEWILGIRTGQWMGFLTRNVMESASSYNEAKHSLTVEEMLAPAYFILGGNATSGLYQQGCVITRARDSAVDVWDMERANGWYVLETNYDHWEAPLFLDNRRTPAHHCMGNMTQQGVSIKGLHNVLSSRPVLNKLTTYTALMQVDSGHLEAWLQYCPEPCVPW